MLLVKFIIKSNPAAELYPVACNNVRIQERFDFKTPAEVRNNELKPEVTDQYPTAENRRIAKYKAEFIAKKEIPEAYLRFLF